MKDLRKCSSTLDVVLPLHTAFADKEGAGSALREAIVGAEVQRTMKDCSGAMPLNEVALTSAQLIVQVAVGLLGSQDLINGSAWPSEHIVVYLGLLTLPDRKPS